VSQFWLIEEHTMAPYGDSETIAWHQIVEANDAEAAFVLAEAARRDSGYRQPGHCDSDEWCLAFDKGELAQVVPGYLWQAADGSSIAYEVRCLGNTEIQMDHLGIAPPRIFWS